MTEKSCGSTGRILRINVGERSTEIILTNAYSERFVGGLGIAAKIAWDEIKPHTAAFDPENKLIFATGPLTGTAALGSGRMEIVGKSPRTFPAEVVTRSGMGGHWGVELKYAGYDGVVLEGEAREPLYIFINEEKVDFLEAGELWGKDTFSTQKWLKEKHGAKVQAVCIGPAGENKSRIATIMSETSFTSGKSGFGAVMGAKKVKAIVVDGRNGGIPVAHPGPRSTAPMMLTKCWAGFIFAMPIGILVKGEMATPIATRMMARATVRVSTVTHLLFLSERPQGPSNRLIIIGLPLQLGIKKADPEGSAFQSPLVDSSAGIIQVRFSGSATS